MSAGADLARATRAAQGKPEHVDDVAVLAQVAALLGQGATNAGPKTRRSPSPTSAVTTTSGGSDGES
jgi:hypothetical protein